MKKIIVVSLWTLLALGIIASALGFTAIYNGWIGYMPPIEELQNPINRFATQVISADGKIMGTWNYNRENRIMVDYTQLSPSLVKAFPEAEECGRWLYHYAAVSQAALFGNCP